jgi:protein TonB
MTFATPVGARPWLGSAHTLRWLVAAALTLLAHAAAVWAVVGWRSAVIAPSEPPPAIMIDLPVAPSSRAPERNVADDPQMTEATPSPSDRVAEKTTRAMAPNPNPLVPEAPAEAPAPERPVVAENPETPREPLPLEAPTPSAETKAESKPPPAQPSETQVPLAPQPPEPAVEDLALRESPAQEAEPPPPASPQPPETRLPATPTSTQAPDNPADMDVAHAAHARPAPKAEPVVTVVKAPGVKTVKPKPATPPKTQAAQLEGQKTEAENKRVIRTKSTKVDDQPAADRARAPSGSAAPTARTAASPNSSSGASLTSALATWKGELVAHINRFKRFPANAASSGTASVAFAINRAGAVLSVRLISSSGDHALDEEAVALLYRASPTPPPPAQMGGGVIFLTVPIRFDR